MLNTYILFKLLCFFFIASTAAQKPNFKYLGCFLAENLFSLGSDIRILSPISPTSCSEYCSGKQYKFFILTNDTCYCNKNYVSSLMKELDGYCTIKCTGDNSASCGGLPNLVSLYTTDISKSTNFIRHGGYPIPIYLGCYAETPNDDENRLLKGPAEPYSNNTPQACSEICFDKGYLYFGVTYGSECWCGNQQPSKLLKVEEINCITTCSGDNKLYCGGGWKIGIYSTGLTDHVPRKFVGCFENGNNKTQGEYLSYDMGSNNSPKRCMNLCNTQQFKYASVKGNVCECKNIEPDLSLKRSVSDCNIMCKENPSEFCGGSSGSSSRDVGVTLENIYKSKYSDIQGEMVMNYIGCFKHFRRHPVLSGWKLTVSRLTPQFCANICFARMFPYAAIISSNECLCSFIKPHNDSLIEDRMCNTPCPSARKHSCGGNKAMNVFSIELEPKTIEIGNHYLGCFEESPNNRIFNRYSKSFLTNTPQFCSNLCYKFGFTYSGVTYKSECFCGSQSPIDLHFTKTDDKHCNTKCSGDANQFCGGGWRMGVFSTGLHDFQISDRYLGCFLLQEDAFSNKKFELIYTNTPSKCSAICYDSGYQFSGVVGMNCICTDSAPTDDQKTDDSDCDTSCVGNSSETCGGEDRIQIYNLKRLNNVINNGELTYHISNPTKEYSNLSESTTLNEEFDSLNLISLWSHDIYIAQDPDYEFVVYNNSEINSFVQNGELVIKPTIQSDERFVMKGSLIMNGCTQNENVDLCSKNATSFYILPPVISAKLTTKNHLFFQYGKLEVIAKLPAGDWIVPEIALISKYNKKNKLVLATLFGNNDLKCNGNDNSATILRYGLKIDEQYRSKSGNMMNSTLAKPWSNDYHSFVLIWSPKNITFKIDGENKNLNTSNLPMDIIFESEYFISIGVSVGGMINFPDGCLSNDHLKPWENTNPRAMLKFWRDRSHWSSTWDGEKSTLRVKSVKLTALEDNV